MTRPTDAIREALWRWKVERRRDQAAIWDRIATLKQRIEALEREQADRARALEQSADEVLTTAYTRTGDVWIKEVK